MADARLMAAAPTLLAALKAIKFATASHASGFGKKDTMIKTAQTVMKLACAAIAKAESA